MELKAGHVEEGSATVLRKGCVYVCVCLTGLWRKLPHEELYDVLLLLV